MVARWQEAHKALEEALDLELKYKPRSDVRIAQTLEMIAVAYRREGQLEKASETYRRIASYGSLSKAANEDLRSTLDAIQKHKATLEVAFESARVLEKTAKDDVKDLIYVYALIAKTQAELAKFEESNTAIDKLLTILEDYANQLSTADERPIYRALAHVFEGSQAGSEGNFVEARAHFQMALHDTTDDAMRWVISRGLSSVQNQK
jgi:tetratricopeptide (TPR) repeat protein